MVFTKTTAQYNFVSRVLHWLLAALIILELILGLCNSLVGAEFKNQLVQLHKSLGILILLLVAARLGWRLLNKPPQMPAAMPKMLKLAAHASHWLLYGLMFAMPLSGWFMTSASGRELRFADQFTLPALINKDRHLGIILRQMHELMAYALIALVIAHICAAIYHHYLNKDEVLRSMI